MRGSRFPVESWQFDEISRQVADSRPLRDFTRGRERHLGSRRIAWQPD
jgi:hypothetical protein